MQAFKFMHDATTQDVKQMVRSLKIIDGANSNIVSGIFPDSLKIALVVPVQKKRKKPVMSNNYRPISLVSVFANNFEKLMKCQFLE